MTIPDQWMKNEYNKYHEHNTPISKDTYWKRDLLVIIIRINVWKESTLVLSLSLSLSLSLRLMTFYLFTY